MHAPPATLRDGIAELIRPGDTRLPGPELLRGGRVFVALVILTINLVGTCAVLAIALFVLPAPIPAHVRHVELVNAIVAAAYFLIAAPVGVLLGTIGLFRLRRWLAEEREPTAVETRIVLRAPLRLFVVQVSLWLLAAVLFGILNLTYSTRLGVRIGILVALTGIVTASCAYLVSELVFRPVAARALARSVPSRLAVPGVATRAVLAWLMGTALPLFGVVAIGILALAGDRTATQHALGVSMVVLGGIGISVGLLAVTVAARATADPVDSVRRALAEVQQGNFDVRVPVYDGTQIGQLQLGFNEMVGGLAERERIRETRSTGCSSRSC